MFSFLIFQIYHFVDLISGSYDEKKIKWMQFSVISTKNIVHVNKHLLNIWD